MAVAHAGVLVASANFAAQSNKPEERETEYTVDPSCKYAGNSKLEPPEVIDWKDLPR